MEKALKNAPSTGKTTKKINPKHPLQVNFSTVPGLPGIVFLEFPDGTVKKMEFSDPETKVMHLDGGDFAFSFKISGVCRSGMFEFITQKPQL